MRWPILGIVLAPTLLLAGGGVEPGLAIRRTAGEHLKANRKTEALQSLRTLMDLHTGYDPGHDDRMVDAFKDDPAFRELVLAAKREFPSRVRSQLAFTVSDPDLIPEGMAYDSAGRMFYLGCLPGRKILRVDPGGRSSDFVAPGQDGLGAVLGLHVDSRRRILWAASESASECGVFGFELGSGKLVSKALLPKEGHLINDLVVTVSGDVLATDSDGGGLYLLKAGSTRLEALPVKVEGPNGLALSPHGGILFVSESGSGILRIDLKTLESAPLGRPGNLSLLGADGLYFLGRSLIAVRNWYSTPQIVRYHLDPPLRQIVRVEILERRDPSWHLPTTGAIAEGRFYFMANTQVDRYAKGEVTPGPALAPIRVLWTPLFSSSPNRIRRDRRPAASPGRRDGSTPGPFPSPGPPGLGERRRKE